MSILRKITEKKRERLDYAKRKIPLRDLKSRILDREKYRDFTTAIKRNGEQIKFIAEIKKASPSRGVIREEFDVPKIARIYEDKAVDAVSVITEEDFFLGTLNYIPLVKETVTKPVLRKDFIIDEYQIYESAAYGADALLLIAALLEGAQTEEYLCLSRELGLSVLCEVHNHDELERILQLDAGIIGINNRNLNTFAVDINTTFLLKKEMPSGKISVSESGIRTRNDVVRLEHAGIDAVLIGTALLESADIGSRIDELRRSA